MLARLLMVGAVAAAPSMSHALDLIEIRLSGFSVPEGRLPSLIVVTPCGFSADDLPGAYTNQFMNTKDFLIRDGPAHEWAVAMQMLGQQQVYLADESCTARLREASQIGGSPQFKETPIRLE